MKCGKCNTEHPDEDNHGTEAEPLCHRCAFHERIKQAQNARHILERSGYAFYADANSYAVRWQNKHVRSFGRRKPNNQSYDHALWSSVDMLERAIAVAAQHHKGLL